MNLKEWRESDDGEREEHPLASDPALKRLMRKHNIDAVRVFTATSNGIKEDFEPEHGDSKPEELVGTVFTVSDFDSDEKTEMVFKTIIKKYVAACEGRKGEDRDNCSCSNCKPKYKTPYTDPIKQKKKKGLATYIKGHHPMCNDRRFIELLSEHDIAAVSGVVIKVVDHGETSSLEGVYELGAINSGAVPEKLVREIMKEVRRLENQSDLGKSLKKNLKSSSDN